MQGACKNKQLGLYLLSIIYILLCQGLHKYTVRQLTGLQYVMHTWCMNTAVIVYVELLARSLILTNARLINIQWCIVGVTITHHSVFVVCSDVGLKRIVWYSVASVRWVVKLWTQNPVKLHVHLKSCKNNYHSTFWWCFPFFWFMQLKILFSRPSQCIIIFQPHRPEKDERGENDIVVDVIKTLLSDYIMSTTCPLNASCCDRMIWSQWVG